MENFLLDSVSFVGNIDFALVLRLFFYIYLFFWVMVVIWVWFDASERSSNILFKVFSVIVSLLFNIFGLLIYLLVRPSDSYEERYLSELEKKYLQLETSGLIKCPECSFDLEPGFVVCPRCGESVKVKCENCDMYIESWWEFCAYCGIEREVSDKLKVKIDDVCDVPEKINVRREYYLIARKYLCKVGEKQNECLERTREFLKKTFKKDKQTKKKKKVKSKVKSKVTRKVKKRGRRKK